MMEQQIQERDRQRPEEQTRRTPEARQPERERLVGPGQVARAALEEVSLLEMPPARLEELAALMGNQGMVALLEQQSLPLEETWFTLPEAAQTEPFPVPACDPALAPELPALTAGEGGRAFDPAGLSYGGGGAYG